MTIFRGMVYSTGDSKDLEGPDSGLIRAAFSTQCASGETSSCTEVSYGSVLRSVLFIHASFWLNINTLFSLQMIHSFMYI